MPPSSKGTKPVRGLWYNVDEPGQELEGARQLPLELIDPNPYQTRQGFDEGFLTELTDHLRNGGRILQPIRVRPGEDGRYQIVNGEQRFRAATAAGRTTIPALIEALSDEEADFATFEENARRTNPHPEDVARHLARLQQQYQLSERDLAKRTGMPRSTINNHLRTLRQRPELLARLGLPDDDPARLTWHDVLRMLTKPPADSTGVAYGKPDTTADSSGEEAGGDETPRGILTERAELDHRAGTGRRGTLPRTPWRTRPLLGFMDWAAQVDVTTVPPQERSTALDQIAEARNWLTRLELQLQELSNNEME